MITSFWGLARSFIKVNKFRVILSIISVMISIGLLISIVMTTNNSVKGNVETLRVIGFGLSIIILIVSGLFIANNFRLFIYESKKELAIIRTIGGKSVQNLKLVFFQVFYILIIGAVLGIGLAYVCDSTILKVLRIWFNVRIYSHIFNWFEAIRICVWCLLAIFGFLVFNLMSSIKLLPVQAMLENENKEFSKSKLRKSLAILLLTLGICGIIISDIQEDNINSSLNALFSGILLVIGAYLCLTYIVKNIFKIMLPIGKIIGGNISYVAIKNMIPHSKRNLMVILALSGSVTLTVFGSSILSSVKINTRNSIYKEYVSDIVLSSRDSKNSKFRYDIKNDIKKINGVIEAVPISTPDGIYINAVNDSPNSISNHNINYALADLKALNTMKLLPKYNGDIKNTIILTQKYARALALKVGDRITVKNYINLNRNAGEITLKVGAVVNSLPGLSYDEFGMVDWSNKLLQTQYTGLNKVLVKIDHARRKEVITELDKFKLQYPELKLTTLKQALSQFEEEYKQRWSIFIVSLAIIVIIVSFGIGVTLNSYLQEQRMEFAILRAICITPAQLLKVIYTQNIMYNLLGLITGYISSFLLMLSLKLGAHEPLSISLAPTFCVSVGVMVLNLIIIIPGIKKILKNSVNEEIVSVAR